MTHAVWIRWLDEPISADARLLDELGGKGANLARMRAFGLPVPPGFVITTAAYSTFLAASRLEDLAVIDLAALPARMRQEPIPDDLGSAILAAYQRLGEGAVAVRSSGTAEDLAAASFAGQHDTFLNVSGPDALLSAVRACWASLWAPRAVAYRQQRGWDADPAGEMDGAPPLALAVVVQVMVQAEAAGVAFTANPLTGDRTEATISAVRGLGEQLVSGEGVADEWIVRGVGADMMTTRRGEANGALTEKQALAVARLARRVEERFGAPQDIEWARGVDGTVYLLQARPMTALPEPVTWVSPTRSGWMRNFRLGEWLPEPVTPLCESWLLARIEHGEVAAEERDYGMRPKPPYHVLANGWYFSSPIGAGLPLRGLVYVLTHHPGLIATLALSTKRPDFGERAYIAPVARRWRDVVLPQYQRLVAAWEGRVETASPADLIAAIDQIAETAGDYLWCLSVAGGHAWKAEHALARLYQTAIAPRDARLSARGHQALLIGLPASFAETPSHAVQSLDWMRPTLGEGTRGSVTGPDLAARRARMADERRAAEVACRAALAGQPRRRRRFETLLALAQRYAILREEQAGWFTLGWPVMRRAALRLGEQLRQIGAIEQAEDVFFVTKAELDACIGASQAESGRDVVDLRARVAARRGIWERQRRLSPPLTIGNPLGARVIARAADGMRASGVARAPEAARADVLVGMPASPGRASGPVRVIHGPEDFDRFQPGEVLVAQVTAPAWTPLFDRAVAVVTDGGSLAAHASLVAREYGIPAVVGVSDATLRLRDGRQVIVDGSAGVVEALL